MYSHRFSRDSNSRDSSQGTSNSTNGAPSEQESSRPQASSRGGWGRPNGDNRPQASGGSGWGRPQHASETSRGGWGRSSFQPSSAAVGGGWGRPNPSSHSFASGGAARPSSTPNFACVLIAALLLLPGVTQPIADEFTQSYIQRNVIVDPHTQDDIDRALAEFNQQQQQQRQQKPPAPPEGYTVEYVSHCFCDKYDLPDNLQASFDANVSSYILKNPKPFTMKIETAVARALLHIHESLSKENCGAIPERTNRDCKEISDVENFYQNLRATLVSYDLASKQFVDQFLADYLKKKPHECVFPIDDRKTGCNKCLTFSSLYTEIHKTHAIFSFFQKVNIIDAVTRKLNLASPGQIPLSSLPSDIRKLIMAATDRRCGEVPNAFLIISPPDCLNDKLRAYLNGALITFKSQSKIRTYPLTSSEKKEGKISIYMQDKTFTQNSFDKSKVLYAPKMAFSQYTPSNFRSIGIKLEMGETPDWKAKGISCSYSPAEMKKTNRDFCRIAQEWGGVPLCVVNDIGECLSIDDVSEEDPSSYPSDPSHNHWGAAAAAP
jgi:hypothetical protein